MEDEFGVVNRRVCRLCLAPETECVPIFTTSAADKEPLSNKILTCVSIKVSIFFFIDLFYFFCFCTFGSLWDLGFFPFEKKKNIAEKKNGV